MKNDRYTLDQCIVDVFIIGLDKDYIRFEAHDWYFFDKTDDTYKRVRPWEWLEEKFQETKDRKSKN